jgi:hypothetical protein
MCVSVNQAGENSFASSRNHSSGFRELAENLFSRSDSQYSVIANRNSTIGNYLLLLIHGHNGSVYD